MRITGARAIMEAFVAEEVGTIFGYPGGAIMPTYDALYGYKDKIHHVLVRHEQGAGHAAQGYAMTTGKVGVCLVTSGPGATNLVTPIADAMIDSIPLVCISGQVHADLVGTDAFQEVDIIGVTTPITKWNYQVTRASEIPHVLAKAFYIARTGRPGPVLIDITKNAQADYLDFSYKIIHSLTSYKPNTTPNLKQISTAAKLINESKKPLVLMGHGVLIGNAEEEMKEFAEASQVPVASTLLGLSVFEKKHPLFVGMLGMHGNYAPNILTNQADLIIALGMRFDDRVTSRLSGYAKKAKVIHIDIDPAELNKNVEATVPIVADVKEALTALIPKLKSIDRKGWLDEFKKLEKQEVEKVITAQTQPKKGAITMGETVKLLSDKTDGQAIVAADVGQHQMVAARYYDFKKSHSWINSAGAGTMGYALPAALGAQVGNPKKTVLSISGDGGFQMTLQELATIHQEQIPLKIIVLNNNYLGMVRQWQELFFEERYSFVDLINPNFVTVAQGFGIKGQCVEKRADLNGAIDTMLAHCGPYLLEVVVEKKGKVFPMIPTGAAVDEIRLE